MDLWAFMIGWYLVFSHCGSNLTYDMDPVKRKVILWAIFLVSPVCVWLSSVWIQYCWGLVMAQWLGSINLTQACCLVNLGYLIVPFSYVPRKFGPDSEYGIKP